MNRRENIKTPHYRREIFSAVSLRFIFLFLFFTSIAFSQVNNLQETYEISDPRNPNCPCHKQQQLADEEYALLNKNVGTEISTTKEKQNDPIKIEKGNDFSASALGKKVNRPIYSSGNSKRKKNNQWFRKAKFRFMNKHNKQYRFRWELDNCFEW